MLIFHLWLRSFLIRCLRTRRRRSHCLAGALLKQPLHIRHAQLRTLIAATPLLLQLQQPVSFGIVRLGSQLERLRLVGTLGEVLAGTGDKLLMALYIELSWPCFRLIEPVNTVVAVGSEGLHFYIGALSLIYFTILALLTSVALFFAIATVVCKHESQQMLLSGVYRMNWHQSLFFCPHFCREPLVQRRLT